MCLYIGIVCYLRGWVYIYWKKEMVAARELQVAAIYSVQILALHGNGDGWLLPGSEFFLHLMNANVSIPSVL